MMLIRRRAIRYALLLLPLLAIVVYRYWPQPPAVFADADWEIPDGDTIEVTGTRIPGGAGCWRYHLSTARWEKVPPQVVLPMRGQLSPDIRYPLDPQWALLYRRSDEAPVHADEWHYYERKHFCLVRRRDGRQTDLGVIRHTPAEVGWKLLPDRSGFFVVEHRHIRGDWMQPILHCYSFRTRRWRAIPIPWYTSYDEYGWLRTKGLSVIPSHDGWLVVYEKHTYTDPQFRARYRAELWVNLTTGACRLGEPASNDYLTAFSPDGQYCYLERKILRAPDWPHGAGVIGRTYSRMPQLGTLPEVSWNGIEGPCWSPDSRCIMYFTSEGENTPFGSRKRHQFFRLLERHIPLRFPQPQYNLRYHLVDVSGQEIGSNLGYWPSFVGGAILTDIPDFHLYQPHDTYDPEKTHQTWRYFLVSRSGKIQREVFRRLPTFP